MENQVKDKAISRIALIQAQCIREIRDIENQAIREIKAIKLRKKKAQARRAYRARKAHEAYLKRQARREQRILNDLPLPSQSIQSTGTQIKVVYKFRLLNPSINYLTSNDCEESESVSEPESEPDFDLDNDYSPPWCRSDSDKRWERDNDSLF